MLRETRSSLLRRRSCKAIEHHPNLDDPNIVLNSFILSNTPYREIGWWDGGMSKADLEKCHVLFQKDDRARYIETMLGAVLSSPS